MVVLLILLAAAVGALFAFQQGWFDPAAVPAAEKRAAPRAERPKQRMADTTAPAIELGGTVSGQLTRRDDRRPSGQYQDSFTFAGRSGQRLEVRLASPDFDPLLSITGPGFSAVNDDDAERGTTDSRLAVTLPRTGSYTINVSSYASGQTGNYVLEVAEPRLVSPVVTPALLNGRWRRASDMSCGDPASIRVDGADLEYTYGDVRTVGRVLDGVGRTIRVEMEEGPDGDAEAAFVVAEDGASFTSEGETWLRC
jgi:predicted dehydrogenase